MGVGPPCDCGGVLAKAQGGLGEHAGRKEASVAGALGVTGREQEIKGKVSVGLTHTGLGDPVKSLDFFFFLVIEVRGAGHKLTRCLICALESSLCLLARD